jgi:hypothetical protein
MRKLGQRTKRAKGGGKYPGAKIWRLVNEPATLWALGGLLAALGATRAYVSNCTAGAEKAFSDMKSITEEIYRRQVAMSAIAVDRLSVEDKAKAFEELLGPGAEHEGNDPRNQSLRNLETQFNDLYRQFVIPKDLYELAEKKAEPATEYPGGHLEIPSDIKNGLKLSPPNAEVLLGQTNLDFVAEIINSLQSSLLPDGVYIAFYYNLVESASPEPCSPSAVFKRLRGSEPMYRMRMKPELGLNIR